MWKSLMWTTFLLPAPCGKPQIFSTPPVDGQSPPALRLPVFFHIHIPYYGYYEIYIASPLLIAPRGETETEVPFHEIHL